MQGSPNQSNGGEKGSHIASGSGNQCWFGPLVGTQAALSQEKCECFVTPQAWEVHQDQCLWEGILSRTQDQWRDLSRIPSSRSEGPIILWNSSQKKAGWGISQSSLVKKRDPPYLQWRGGTTSSTCGMALGWKSAPKLLGLVAWGNQTSGLVGTCAKALPSKSWLCWNIIEPSRAGIIFIYLLKSSPTWGGDKGVPVTQA